MYALLLNESEQFYVQVIVRFAITDVINIFDTFNFHNIPFEIDLFQP